MADFWNRRAPSFNAHKSQDAEADARRRELIGGLAEKAGLRPGSRAFDIGCGTGHHALLLAAHASKVVGLDVAPKMTEFAEQNAATEGCGNARFEIVDWERLDVGEKGWRKRFDFVLASRTPAVNSRAPWTK